MGEQYGKLDGFKQRREKKNHKVTFKVCIIL